MVKKKNVKVEYENKVWVIGIASNEKVWKICWEVNAALEIEMATRPRDIFQSVSEEYYVDFESDSVYEFCLIEIISEKKNVPKLAKNFRYWLILKPKLETEPNIPDFIRKLTQISSVALAVDLSEEKDINKYLPWI